MSRRGWQILCLGSLAVAVVYSTFDLHRGEQSVWTPLLIVGLAAAVSAIYFSWAESQSDSERIAIWAALSFPVYVALQLLPLPLVLLRALSLAWSDLASALTRVMPTARFDSLSIAP